MRYRKLDANGDYTFGNGQKDFWIDVPEAVAQAIQTGLLLFQGEWVYDITVGMPWFQGVLGKYTQDSADATVQLQIYNTTGVTNINSFESTTDPKTRNYSVVNADVNTVYGPTTVQIADYQKY